MRPWQYVLPNRPGAFELEAPGDPWPLHVGTQWEQVCFWMMVDPDKPMAKVRGWLGWTGQDVPVEYWGRYVGTTETPSGIVWHLFLAAK